MMSPVAIDIDKSDLFPITELRCHVVYCCYSALENEVSKIANKALVNAHFYRTVIVVTFIIKTRPWVSAGHSHHRKTRIGLDICEN